MGLKRVSKPFYGSFERSQYSTCLQIKFRARKQLCLRNLAVTLGPSWAPNTKTLDGRGIQDAPLFPVSVYKVLIFLCFPPYCGSLDTPHRFCYKKAFLFLFLFQSYEVPFRSTPKHGRIFNTPMGGWHISTE